MIVRGRSIANPYVTGSQNQQFDTYTIRIDCGKFLETWIEIILTKQELEEMLARKDFNANSETDLLVLEFHETEKTKPRHPGARG